MLVICLSWCPSCLLLRRTRTRIAYRRLPALYPRRGRFPSSFPCIAASKTTCFPHHENSSNHAVWQRAIDDESPLRQRNPETLRIPSALQTRLLSGFPWILFRHFSYAPRMIPISECAVSFETIPSIRHLASSLPHIIHNDNANNPQGFPKVVMNACMTLMSDALHPRGGAVHITDQ